MKEVLKIILPSGDSRYVTNISNTDVSYSIYSTNAVEDTPENMAKLCTILNIDKSLKALISVDKEELS